MLVCAMWNAVRDKEKNKLKGRKERGRSVLVPAATNLLMNTHQSVCADVYPSHFIFYVYSILRSGTLPAHVVPIED